MIDQNKKSVRRIIDEVWDREDSASARELFSREYVSHTPEGDMHGVEAFLQYLSSYREAFPDLKFKVEDLFAERDKVVVRWMAQGTHKGEFQNIPATSTQAKAHGITIFRIRDGKVVEDDGVWDRLGLLQQLGVMPEAVQI